MQPHGLRQEAADILFQHCPGDGLWSVADLRLGCLGAFVDVCKDTASRLEWTVWRQDAMQLGAPFIPEDLLSHVSAILLLRHPSVQQALLPQPTSTAVVASWLHGFMVGAFCHGFFVKLMDALGAQATTNAATLPPSTYIQCSGNISRQEERRMGHHVERFVPLILQLRPVGRDEIGITASIASGRRFDRDPTIWRRKRLRYRER